MNGKDITEDYADIDTADFWSDDISIDLDDVEFADDLYVGGNIDLGEELALTEDIDVGDLNIDADHYDLGGYDDFGGYDGYYGGYEDFDGYDDVGGGYMGDDDFGDFGGFDDFGF